MRETVFRIFPVGVSDKDRHVLMSLFRLNPDRSGRFEFADDLSQADIGAVGVANQADIGNWISRQSGRQIPTLFLVDRAFKSVLESSELARLEHNFVLARSPMVMSKVLSALRRATQMVSSGAPRQSVPPQPATSTVQQAGSAPGRSNQVASAHMGTLNTHLLEVVNEQKFSRGIVSFSAEGRSPFTIDFNSRRCIIEGEIAQLPLWATVNRDQILTKRLSVFPYYDQQTGNRVFRLEEFIVFLCRRCASYSLMGGVEHSANIKLIRKPVFSGFDNQAQYAQLARTLQTAHSFRELSGLDKFTGEQLAVFVNAAILCDWVDVRREEPSFEDSVMSINTMVHTGLLVEADSQQTTMPYQRDAVSATTASTASSSGTSSPQAAPSQEKKKRRSLFAAIRAKFGLSQRSAPSYY